MVQSGSWFSLFLKLRCSQNGYSSRTQFMIETLTNLKNNKLKRNTTQNQGGAAVERMKKFLTGLTKSRHGKFPIFSRYIPLFYEKAH